MNRRTSSGERPAIAGSGIEQSLVKSSWDEQGLSTYRSSASEFFTLRCPRPTARFFIPAERQLNSNPSAIWLKCTERGANDVG